MIKQRQTPMRMPLQARHALFFLIMLIIAALLSACGASASLAPNSAAADARVTREARPTLIFVYADG
jgi:outer membrane biogenesis lipoprotein LolB